MLFDGRDARRARRLCFARRKCPAQNSTLVILNRAANSTVLLEVLLQNAARCRSRVFFELACGRRRNEHSNWSRTVRLLCSRANELDAASFFDARQSLESISRRTVHCDHCNHGTRLVPMSRTQVRNYWVVLECSRTRQQQRTHSQLQRTHRQRSQLAFRTYFRRTSCSEHMPDAAPHYRSPSHTRP